MVTCYKKTVNHQHLLIVKKTWLAPLSSESGSTVPYPEEKLYFPTGQKNTIRTGGVFIFALYIVALTCHLNFKWPQLNELDLARIKKLQ